MIERALLEKHCGVPVAWAKAGEEATDLTRPNCT